MRRDMATGGLPVEHWIGVQMDDHTGRSTIADRLLTRLVEAGVGHVFGVRSDDNLRLLNLIDAHPDLEWVGSSSELTAAHAADGYARVHGLAALLTTYGTGEPPAIDSIAASFAESVPVLMIAGTPTTPVQDCALPMPRSLRQGDSGQFACAFGPVTCASALLRADDAAAEIDRVLGRMLADMRPGCVGLPADLVGAPAPEPAPRPADRASALAGLERALADEATITAEDAERRFADRARTMLAGASSVVVLAGHLVDRYRVQRHLDVLIRCGNFRSATIAGAKSTIDEGSPGFLGVYAGALSEPSVRDAVEAADVVIGAGLRHFDLTSDRLTTNLDPGRLIDLQPHHAVAATESFDGVGMTAALEALTGIIAVRTGPPALFLVPDAVDPDADDAAPDGPLTHAAFWQRIGGFLRPTDIVAADHGTPFDGLLGVRLPSDVDVIAQPSGASIGYAVPAIMGAQLAAAPGRRGVLFIDDGSLEATVQELATMIRRGMLPVVFMLTSDTAGSDWSRLPGALGAGRVAVIARAGTPAELDAALGACEQGADTLAFVEVVLDRSDMPPAHGRRASRRPWRARSRGRAGLNQG